MSVVRDGSDPGAIDLDIGIDVVHESSASPEQIWSVLWDLDRYREWNPECVEARWVDGRSQPAVGACFSGRNEWNGRTWTVVCHIIECAPPTFVRWTVQDPSCPSSTWTFMIAGSVTGCTISQRFVHGPGNSGIRNMIRADPGSAGVVVAARTQMLTNNMQTGLRAIAHLAEARAATPGAAQ